MVSSNSNNYETLERLFDHDEIKSQAPESREQKFISYSCSQPDSEFPFYTSNRAGAIHSLPTSLLHRQTKSGIELASLRDCQLKTNQVTWVF